MRTFFLILSMLNLLGIIPCFVVFIVMAARKKKKAIWGFMALGCVVGTILFGIISIVLSMENPNTDKKTDLSASEVYATEVEAKETEEIESAKTPTENSKATEAPKTAKPTEAPPTQAPTLSYEEQVEKYKSLCSEISYEDLARNPEKHKGEHLKFRGQVVQVVEPTFGDTTILRVNVTEKRYEYIEGSTWEDTIYCTVSIPKGSDRILEEDIITLWGECQGLTTYQGGLGQQVSIPEISILAYEIDG